LHKKSQTDCNKITNKSPDETDRAWSRSLLQMRDSTPLIGGGNCCVMERVFQFSVITLGIHFSPRTRLRYLGSKSVAFIWGVQMAKGLTFWQAQS